MRVPPILKHEYMRCRFARRISTNGFEDRQHDDSYSYIFTGEYEMPEWNMGHVATTRSWPA